MEATPPDAIPFARPANTLAYVDLPARHGIVYGEAPDGSFFITVPVPIWRQLLGAGGAAILFSMIFNPLAGVAVAVVLAGVAVVRRRLGRPITFRLTTGELRVENVVPTESESDRVYPRRDVYDVKYVGHANAIFIHARGHEMLEIRPAGNREVMAWIAETLHSAMWPPAPAQPA
jgi:hypothetical protein